MDEPTLAAYDRAAAAFADDWHAQPTPTDMYALLTRYLQPGPTADIGCGSGRDTAWLARHGFAAVGYDGSPGLLAEARRRYPDLAFRHARLPEIAAIGDNSFANVLCETVIMHLPAAAIAPAVVRLLAILEPGGTLYLSWRLTPNADRRDEHGRLYTAFDPALVFQALGTAHILHDDAGSSASSGKPVRRLIARKTGTPG